jgi:hypothetical protein
MAIEISVIAQNPDVTIEDSATFFGADSANAVGPSMYSVVALRSYMTINSVLDGETISGGTF